MGDFKIIRKFVTEKQVHKKRGKKIDKFSFSKE